MELQYQRALDLEHDFLFEQAIAMYTAVLEGREYYEDARARLDTLESYVSEAARLYAEAEAASASSCAVNFAQRCASRPCTLESPSRRSSSCARRAASAADSDFVADTLARVSAAYESVCHVDTRLVDGVGCGGPRKEWACLLDHTFLIWQPPS